VSFASILSLMVATALPACPYSIEREGDAAPKTGTSYSVLTLNACMMEGDLPTRWGGMTPAEQRIDRLAAFILREDPDLYLGQEVMSEAGERLSRQLKERYAHFWLGIGKIPGKEESGLFIASKRLINHVEFYPFADEDQVDKKYFPDQTRFLERGFFVLDFGDFLVVTTHLEGGGDFVKGPEHRIRQLEMITRVLDQKGKPYLLAGDLNLNRTGKADDEYTRAHIPRDYFDWYTLHHPEVNEKTYTCTNLFTAAANNLPLPPEEDRFEIDDFVLVRKPFADRFEHLDVVLVDTYDPIKPREEALTDHKAYKVAFQFLEMEK